MDCCLLYLVLLLLHMNIIGLYGLALTSLCRFDEGRFVFESGKNKINYNFYNIKNKIKYLL